MNLPIFSTRVGGEIDAMCTKCEMNLAHTILAMVGPKVIRVRCNTCGGDHMYRGTQPLIKSTSFAAPKKSAGPRTPKSEVVTISWEDQLKGKNIAGSRKYSIRDTYKVDEIIDHPTFGLGIVTAVRIDKVDVSFKTFEKTLIHGKAPAPAPTADNG